MSDNKKLASEILQKVGGSENIQFVVNCATRLRFTLKDMSKCDQEGVKNIPGVLGVHNQAGQFQVIIGQTVPDVYAELCSQAGIQQQAAVDDPETETKDAKKKHSASEIFGVISGIFAPAVPAFAGAGILKGIIIRTAFA